MGTLATSGETWVFGAVAVLTVVGAVLVPWVVRRKVPAYLPRLPSTRSLRLAVGLAVAATATTFLLASTRVVSALAGTDHLWFDEAGWVVAGSLAVAALGALAVGIVRVRREGAALHTVSCPALSMLVSRLAVVAVMVANLVYRAGVTALA